MDWRASARLSTRVSIGLLRTKLVEAGQGYGEFTGNEFARSPHLTAATEVNWDASRRLHLSAQGRFHSSYFGDDVNAPGVRVGHAAIINARAEYRLRGLTVFAYARNLFNKFALIERFPGPPGAGLDEATAEDPRMVGVGIEARHEP